MITQILTDAGVEFRRSRFPQPPAGTYAVYTDDVSADGADHVNCIRTHNITVELYELVPDDNAEAGVESAIDARGIHWDKHDRYWLQDVQRYQVVYEFTYIEKRRI